MPKTYWMLVSSLKNFRVTQEQDFTVQGVQKRYKKKAQRIETGDRLLYYIEDARVFAATATVTSTFFQEHTLLWRDANAGEDYPFRVHIKPEVVLSDELFLDTLEIGPRMEYVRKWAPELWNLAFIGNLHLIPKNDFQLIESEMRKAIDRSSRVSRQ